MAPGAQLTIKWQRFGMDICMFSAEFTALIHLRNTKLAKFSSMFQNELDSLVSVNASTKIIIKFFMYNTVHNVYNIVCSNNVIITTF